MWRNNFDLSSNEEGLMTPEYKARRAAKHAAQLASKPPVSGSFVQTIDLTPKGPWHSWFNGKLFKSSSGGLKTRSRYSQEWNQAIQDNKNPYFNKEDGKWYYYDETEQSCETGFVTREQAEIALNDYCDWLNNGPKVVAEPMPVSIGGVPENEGLPGEGL
jgi:hypothetical protein